MLASETTQAPFLSPRKNSTNRAAGSEADMNLGRAGKGRADMILKEQA